MANGESAWRRITKTLAHWSAEGLVQNALWWLLGTFGLATGTAVFAYFKSIGRDTWAAALVGVALALFLGLLTTIYRKVARLEKANTGAAQVAQGGQPTGNPTTTTVNVPSGSNYGVAAIGTIWLMSFVHRRQADEDLFCCSCTVNFIGVPGGVKCSPSELRLTGIGGDVGGEIELAQLKAQHVPHSPSGMTYTGTGKWRALMACAEQTMSPEHYGVELPPWKIQPPPAPRGIFCTVEVHIPGGHAGEAHRSSNVKMDFELMGATFQKRLVQVS